MTINLASLYEWNNSLFNDLKLPVAPTPLYEGQFIDDMPPVDKQVIIDNLLFDTYEHEVIIADPIAMQKLIALWSKRHVDRWQKIYNTFWYKYNPIWNKDGLIVETETETRDLAGTAEESGGSEASSSTEGDATSTDSVAGFNEPNTLTANKKNVLEHSDLTTTESSDTRTAATTDTGTIEHERRREEQGNIGVTSTQELIERERSINGVSIYDIIIEEFKKQFILSVY